MSSLKIYIHVELDGYPEKTSKIQVPKSWASKTVKDVIALFVKAYNDKNSSTPIDIDQAHFETSECIKIYSNDTVADVLEDRVDYYIKLGAHVRPSLTEVVKQDDPTLLRCRNYGCNQFFREEDNSDTACQHHTGPPIFHDTMKCWSCCKDIKKAFDFETFQLIAGCNVGRHSTVAQTVAIAASPNAVMETAGTSQPAAAAPLKSISEFNTANPEAATAANAAARILSQDRKSSRTADGLRAKCQRKGCQKEFTVSENNSTACVYHRGQPVFHDAAKYWSCCPDKKCYDFDDFLAVPGCAIGIHDDGVVDLE